VDALDRLVVVAGRVGREGVQAPPVQQPGADLGVGNAPLRFGLQQGGRLVAGGMENAPVLLGKMHPEDDAPDVVQHARQEAELRRIVAGLVGQALGDDRRQQGVTPVELQVEGGGVADPREHLVDGCADRDRPNGVAAELEQGVVDLGKLFCAPVKRRIGHAENADGQGRITADDPGEVLEIRVLLPARLDQLQENLGKRGQMARGLDPGEEGRRPVVRDGFSFHKATRFRESNFRADKGRESGPLPPATWISK